MSEANLELDWAWVGGREGGQRREESALRNASRRMMKRRDGVALALRI